MKAENTLPPIPPKKNSKRKRLLSMLAIFFAVILFVFLLYWLFIGRFYETTDDAYVSGNLVQVMPKTSGHVTEINVDETDLVKKGEPLVNLDKADAEVILKNAESTLALAVRQVNQFYQNVDQLKANVAVQQSNLEKAQEDYKRRLGLVVNKYISREDLQHAKLAVDNTTAALNLAKNQLAAAIDLVANSDLYHHPQVMQAANALRSAYLAWARTTIFSPEEGYVAKRNVQVGQEVGMNTVLMVIVPINQVWVDANYKESQLRNIRIGQPVEVIADAYGSGVTFHGKVIGLNPGTGSAFDLLPPQNATGNWIKIVQRLPVRISIDPEELKKHPLRIGLSVTTTVNTSNRKGIALSEISQDKVIYKTLDESDILKKADQLINQILQKNAKDVTYPATP